MPSKVTKLQFPGCVLHDMSTKTLISSLTFFYMIIFKIYFQLNCQKIYLFISAFHKECSAFSMSALSVSAIESL